MAERERRRRSRREGGRTFRRLSSEGKDGDWIAELRHDLPDDVVAGRPVAPAREPAPYDAQAAAGAPPPATPPPSAPPPPAADDDPWQLFADVLEAQQSTLVALAERVDAVEARLDAALRRERPAGPRPGGPRPDVATMREVVDALRASAVGSAARLGREVARRRR